MGLPYHDECYIASKSDDCVYYNIVGGFSDIVLFHRHEISWFYDDGYVRWHLNSWISNYRYTGICNINKVNKQFVRVLYSSISLPTKTTELNVQRIKMILHYIDTNYKVRLYSRGRPGGHHIKTKVTSTARQCLRYCFIITTLCYLSSTYTIINITKVYSLIIMTMCNKRNKVKKHNNVVSKIKNRIMDILC